MMDRLKDRIGDAVAVALLFLLVLACTWRIGLAGRVLAGGDIFTYFHPYWAEATRAVRAGRLPLWNPYLFMGVPFVANSQVGFFYPLNWALWITLPAHRSVHVTIVLHLCLAALNAYLWARRSFRLGPVGAWTVGAAFGLGGYLGAQVEHVNQLHGLAWLPLMLMLSDQIVRRSVMESASGRASGAPARDVGGIAPVAAGRRRLGASCAMAVVFALVLLAGHTQTAFISIFAVGAYGLVPVLWRSLTGGSWRPVIEGAVLLGVGAVLGAALAAVQLLPTWQLSRLSVRAQGLPFNERLSFSLSPLYVGRALLPSFGYPVPPHHLEHVAYVGTTGLALAIVALVIDLRHRDKQANCGHGHHPVYVLILLGLIFALGVYNPLYILLARYVPGFAHFRVPARWLALYGSGVAALVGCTVHALWQRTLPGRDQLPAVGGSLAGLVLWAVAGTWLGGERFAEAGLDLVSIAGWAAAGLGAMGLLWLALRGARSATIGLLILLTLELFLANRTLPQARATAPQAFTSLRPAVAHLLASERVNAGQEGRFLSMSDITFDPGDLSLIQGIYGSQLSEDQLYDYIVATKQKEVVSPNLPLAFGVSAVDGYDGGLLPLQRYVALQQLFLPEEKVSIDGRLRENLTKIPEAQWLDLFNVRYVITDKLQDAWIDDVFYDLQFTTRLALGDKVPVAEVPDFEATALGLVSYLERGSAVPDGTPVGVVRLLLDDGRRQSFELRAGNDLPLSSPDGQVGDPMVTRLRWSDPGRPVSVTLEAISPHTVWVVRGISLIDERTGSFQSLVLSDHGRFRLAHSGDVKVYEKLDVLPRAFIVHQAEVVDDDEAALEAMQDPTFDPSSVVVLSDGDDLCSPLGALGASTDASRSASAIAVAYQPERVVIETSLLDPGYLVLTDVHYPGWRATVDGEAVPICRGDILFRAIALEAGEHRVVFTFQPSLQRLGMVVSVAGLIVLFVLWCERRIVESRVRCYNGMHK